VSAKVGCLYSLECGNTTLLWFPLEGFSIGCLNVRSWHFSAYLSVFIDVRFRGTEILDISLHRPLRICWVPQKFYHFTLINQEMPTTWSPSRQLLLWVCSYRVEITDEIIFAIIPFIKRCRSIAGNIPKLTFHLVTGATLPVHQHTPVQSYISILLCIPT